MHNQKEYTFNVYTGSRWRLVDTFYAGNDWGLNVGGLKTFAKGTLYTATVTIKRMS